MSYKLIFIFLISVSKLYASSCEVDQTKLFCANPLEYICKDADKVKQENLDSNISSIKGQAARHFYEKNKELLQRHGVFDLSAASMEKIRDLLIQCHETQAEMAGLCEESLFLGIDIRKVYASAAATGDDSGFWSGFNQQLKDQYQDYLDELIVKNEEVLRDIGKGVLGHFQDAMVDQIKSYYQNRPRSAAVKIKNLKRKLKNVYFIFSRRSPEIRHFSHEIKLKIIRFYNVACRSMADGDNAFVFNDRDTRKKVVVMCPGAYLRQGLSDVQNFNATEIAPRILSVFTHEFAHILNSRKNKRSFIVDNFPYRLRSCHQTWYDLPEDVSKNYNRYYKEIEADVLGNLALGKMLRSESFSSVSKERKLDIIKSSYGIFCNKPGGKSHPPGNFRIEKLMFRTPDIFNEFGCHRVYKDKVMMGCGLDGSRALYLFF